MEDLRPDVMVTKMLVGEIAWDYVEWGKLNSSEHDDTSYGFICVKLIY